MKKNTGGRSDGLTGKVLSGNRAEEKRNAVIEGVRLEWIEYWS